jgi:anti-sigma regulatory factor (Ser/Thr protein kinase)
MFAAEPHSVRAARRFATEALAGSAADVRESVELMVSELATNGIRHGQTSFRLVIETTPREIRVEVTDGGAGTPQMRFPGPDEPTGRGLRIVDMLSERWGVERDSQKGKTVWFTLSVAAEQSAIGDAASGGAGQGLALR